MFKLLKQSSMIRKLLSVAFLMLCFCVIPTKAIDMSAYNIIWNSQSENSKGSMPLGGGDVGCNVWVEGGDLLMYLSKSGTFDENNSMLKLGRVRIHFEGKPFDTKFQQTLSLNDGSIYIEGNDLKVHLWVEVFRPVVHIETSSVKGYQATVSFESWRTDDRSLTTKERHQCFGYSNTTPEKIPVYTRPDTFEPGNASFIWYHANRDDELITEREAIHQHLGPVLDQLWDPIKGLVFGGKILLSNMKYTGTKDGSYAFTDCRSWNYKTKKKLKTQDIAIILGTVKDGNAESLKTFFSGIEREATSLTQRWKKNCDWWQQFWDRSYILIDTERPGTEGWTIGRNYNLFRYQLACNAYGEWPTKFNGSLFTYDPGYFKPNYKDCSPDFRMWGGGSFTAQNQRLVYWPMIKAGDFDMMISQFDFYRLALGNAELRTRVYWGHEGASFTEQLNNNGLPAGHTYQRLWGETSLPIQPRSIEASTRKLINQKGDTVTVVDFGWITNQWVGDHYDGELEFSKMMLDYYEYGGGDIQAYLPFIDSSIRFHDKHFQYWAMRLNGTPFDENGKLILYPGSCLETYKYTVNAVNTVAAMQSVLEQLIRLNLGTKEQQAYWKEVLKTIPGINYREKSGHQTISPAKSWVGGAINNEIPQLYPVFPYRLFGVGRPQLELARNTFRYGADKQSQHASPTTTWHPDAVYTADLGMTEEAEKYVKMKLCNSNTTRFPTFWGTGDWGPDHNWGGVGNIALQEMLMQDVDNTLYLFPAWPKHWNVKFKLHAPNKTIVTAEWKDGKVLRQEVSPKGPWTTNISIH
jgi:hypothetical protein